MKKKYGRINSCRGFTLLEILVVMVIASLMVALVPPLFSGAVTGAKIKGSVRDLAITLRESRSKAITYNIEQSIHFDMEKHQYSIDDKKPVALAENMTMDVELITGTTLKAVDKHVIYFFPDGSSSGELITLKSGNYIYHLQLNWLTGNITISSGAEHAA